MKTKIFGILNSKGMTVLSDEAILCQPKDKAKNIKYTMARLFIPKRKSRAEIIKPNKMAAVPQHKTQKQIDKIVIYLSRIKAESGNIIGVTILIKLSSRKTEADTDKSIIKFDKNIEERASLRDMLCFTRFV